MSHTHTQKRGREKDERQGDRCSWTDSASNLEHASSFLFTSPKKIIKCFGKSFSFSILSVQESTAGVRGLQCTTISHFLHCCNPEEDFSPHDSGLKALLYRRPAKANPRIILDTGLSQSGWSPNLVGFHIQIRHSPAPTLSVTIWIQTTSPHLDGRPSPLWTGSSA